MRECTDATFTNRSFVCLAIAIALSTGFFACRDKGPNTVVAYLQGAERQSEDMDQRREIEKALNDMLTVSPDELRKRRYANYQMQPGAWTIIDVFHKYFLPSKPGWSQSETVLPGHSRSCGAGGHPGSSATRQNED
jgi:hypothetical protein